MSQDQPQVGPAMWGGARLPSDRVTPIVPGQQQPVERVVDLRDVVALVALIVGGGLLVAGAAVAWGLAGVLLTLGVVAVVTGVLLGLGER